MKYITASCYAVGAVLWPFVAGLMLGEGQIFVAGVLVAYSFIAYWKGYQWLRKRIVMVASARKRPVGRMR